MEPQGGVEPLPLAIPEANSMPRIFSYLGRQIITPFALALCALSLAMDVSI